jgi:hypothetical protein
MKNVQLTQDEIDFILRWVGTYEPFEYNSRKEAIKELNLLHSVQTKLGESPQIRKLRRSQ